MLNEKYKGKSETVEKWIMSCRVMHTATAHNLWCNLKAKSLQCTAFADLNFKYNLVLSH